VSISDPRRRKAVINPNPYTVQQYIVWVGLSKLNLAIVLVAGAAFSSGPLRAQTSGNTFAVINGTAVDSIRGGYLAGAAVRVNGTSHVSMTDSLGRFRIDSVTVGSHRLELIHPLLDTLGMVLKTPPISFRAGDNGSIRLSIPSGQTVVAAKCSATEREAGPAAVVGMVIEAEGDAPATGAGVSLEWTDLEPTEKGFRKVIQRRNGTVKDDGSFRICGLPADLSANAVAARRSDSTSVVGVHVGPFLSVITLFLPGRASAAVTGPRRSGVLMGTITGPDRAPIARARVAVDGEGDAAVSSDNGAFTLAGLRSGTRVVSIRALGYQPVERVVTITSLSPRTLNIQLEKFVAVLKTVRIGAIRDAALERVGFAERKRDQPTGKFFTPEDIERRNPQRLKHLLETVQGLRGGCTRYFIDGVKLTSANSDPRLDLPQSSPTSRDDSTPDSFLNPAELGAVEVYNHINAPGEYLSIEPNGRTCDIVVIWTKFRLGL
jgi:hypothetical protein